MVATDPWMVKLLVIYWSVHRCTSSGEGVRSVYELVFKFLDFRGPLFSCDKNPILILTPSSWQIANILCWFYHSPLISNLQITYTEKGCCWAQQVGLSDLYLWPLPIVPALVPLIHSRTRLWPESRMTSSHAAWCQCIWHYFHSQLVISRYSTINPLILMWLILPMQKNWKMTEILAHGYSSENTQYSF